MLTARFPAFLRLFCPVTANSLDIDGMPPACCCQLRVVWLPSGIPTKVTDLQQCNSSRRVEGKWELQLLELRNDFLCFLGSHGAEISVSSKGRTYGVAPFVAEETNKGHI